MKTSDRIKKAVNKSNSKTTATILPGNVLHLTDKKGKEADKSMIKAFEQIFDMRVKDFKDCVEGRKRMNRATMKFDNVVLGIITRSDSNVSKKEFDSFKKEKEKEMLAHINKMRSEKNPTPLAVHNQDFNSLILGYTIEIEN